MSLPIPQHSHGESSTSNNSSRHSSASPVIMTPSGTPPPSEPQHHQADRTSGGWMLEHQLNKLLANFDSGTHSFCRQERETPEERAHVPAWTSDALRKQAPARRPSHTLLSALTLTRPSDIPLPASNPNSAASTPYHTPAHTPLSGSFPKHHQFSMTEIPASSNTSASSRPLSRSQTMPGGDAPRAPGMQRAMTGALAEESKRRGSAGTHHFDPSREPKLLGLL